MELTAENLRRLPAENIRVPRAEFVTLWTAAEAAHDRLTGEKVLHWDVWGVAATCRWMARATSRPATGPRYLTPSPVTGREQWALPELITKEQIAAEVLLLRWPAPRILTSRPGWIEAITETLQWAWGGSRHPPVCLEVRAEVRP